MKKTLYILASLSAMLFVSCAKEVDVKEEPVEEATLVTGTTLRAAVEGVDTKVSANAVGEYKWQASDKIAVLNDAGDVYEFTAASAGSTSEFSCASSITLGSYAAYPYSTSFAASGNAVTFEIPSTITYSADATNMPMLGKISGDNVTFKAVGGLLKLIVYGVPSGSTRLEFAAKAQKINGSFAIADASIAAPVIATADKGATDNTITIDYTGKYNANMVFYIPLPTGTIEGFDLTFNDAGNTTKSVSVNLTVARNEIILAPTLNMVTPANLLLETFDTDLTDGGDPATATVSDYNSEKKGQTVYGGNTVNYSINAVTGTKLYIENLAGGAGTGELLLNKKVDSNDGTFTIEDIPTAGATFATITYVTNNSAAARCTITSPTDGVEVFGRTVTGSSAPITVTHTISIESGISVFNLQLANSSSYNVRIDDIVIATAAPSPNISFDGNGTRTIAAGANTASSNVTGVILTGAIDGTGIGISTSADWLSASLSGSTLSITSTEYNHTEEDRIGYVYLKATGATTKQITVTQKPSIVSSPSLSKSTGNQTFTVTWTPDGKAKTYIAYYSTTDNMADPTTGTALVVDDSSTPYTVSASGLTNGTTYYIYVKVSALKDAYSVIYSPSTIWAKISATPTSGVSLDYTEDFSSKTVGSSNSYNTDTWSGASSTSWSLTYGSTALSSLSTNSLNVAIGKSSNSGALSFSGSNGITALSFNYKAQGNAITMRVVIHNGTKNVYSHDTEISKNGTGTVSISSSDFSETAGTAFTVTISNQTDSNSLQLGVINWTSAK